LSVAQLTNLQLTAEGYAQTQIAMIRSVSKAAVRTQSKKMLEKTGDLTLAFAAIRMLRGE
jgi:DNA-binding CsgD family transcriptional regulator